MRATAASATPSSKCAAPTSAAIALYHDLGFECVGQRRGYYQAQEGREDALVYRLELGALPDAQ